MQNIFDDAKIFYSGQNFTTSYNKLLRHTHFSMQDKIIYSNTECFSNNPKKIILQKHGDLLNNLTFFIELPETENWVDDIEFALVKKNKSNTYTNK